MKAWVVVEAEKPLKEIELPTPKPTGTEVLLEVTHSGVCHSDIHFWKGEYNLGGGKSVKLSDRGITLPRAPGHEIAGRVVAVGEDVKGVKVGDIRVAYPWLGCGECEHCLAEEDNLCVGQRSLGVVRHGGFGSHVLVPHSRYLIDPGSVDLSLAATYACSGITTYSAIKKIMPLAPDKPVVLVGAGGLGLTAIAMLKAFGHRNIISVDISDEKLAAAKKEGATGTVNSSTEGAAQRILEVAGGSVPAVIDFVGMSATSRMGFDVLVKNGKLIIVGVAGGELTLLLGAMVFGAFTVQGSITGTIQDLRDVIALAAEGKLPPTPITCMEKHCANEAMVALRDGKVTGRVVLLGEH
ncbi:MAG: alcohol dehydrogenase [Porticoccaceae bacterium]|jgi:alcohol dehydrogenase/propanol-preferring alcohol dehydrogenase|nr:alcohol dehydrogenase [Porticoccaceae bacterium]